MTQTPNPILTGNNGANVTMILTINANKIIFSQAIFTILNTEIYQSFLRNVFEIIGEYTYN